MLLQIFSYVTLYKKIYKKFNLNEATKYTNENKHLERKLLTIKDKKMRIVICYPLQWPPNLSFFHQI